MSVTTFLILTSIVNYFDSGYEYCDQVFAYLNYNNDLINLDFSPSSFILASTILTEINTCETYLIPNLNIDMSYLSSGSPLSQFEIKDFLTLVVIGIALRISNLTVVTGLSATSVVIVSLINNNGRKLVPTRSSVLMEAIYHSVLNIVISQIDNKKGQMFFPFLFSLFIIILSNNLVGMIPYSLASTSEFILTFSLSFTIVIGSTILSLIKYKFVFFSLLVPSGCPLPLLYLLTLIEFISYLARPVSLGLRLAANVLSGHMLLLILSGFAYKMIQNGYLNSILSLLPLSFIICFTALEMGIAIIQAQVFTVLSSSYIKDGLKLH